MKINNRAIQILDSCKKILINKGNDYHNPNSVVLDEDYFKYDLVPGATMLQTKLLRYISTMQANEVNNEAATDSLMDLINYAARTKAYIDIDNEEYEGYVKSDT